LHCYFFSLSSATDKHTDNPPDGDRSPLTFSPPLPPPPPLREGKDDVQHRGREAGNATAFAIRASFPIPPLFFSAFLQERNDTRRAPLQPTPNRNFVAALFPFFFFFRNQSLDDSRARLSGGSLISTLLFFPSQICGLCVELILRHPLAVRGPKCDGEFSFSFFFPSPSWFDDYRCREGPSKREKCNPGRSRFPNPSLFFF